MTEALKSCECEKRVSCKRKKTN